MSLKIDRNNLEGFSMQFALASTTVDKWGKRWLIDPQENSYPLSQVAKSFQHFCQQDQGKKTQDVREAAYAFSTVLKDHYQTTDQWILKEGSTWQKIVKFFGQFIERVAEFLGLITVRRYSEDYRVSPFNHYAYSELKSFIEKQTIQEQNAHWEYFSKFFSNFGRPERHFAIPFPEIRPFYEELFTSNQQKFLL